MDQFISVIGSNIGMAIIAIVGVIVGGAITIIAMNITIKKSKELQLRNELIGQCEGIEVLVAEYCTLVHKLFKQFKHHIKYQQEHGFDPQAPLILSRSEAEIETLRDEIDTIVFKIELKTRHTKDLGYLVSRLQQLKDMPCYVYDNQIEDYRLKTSQLREELADKINKIKETI